MENDITIYSTPTCKHCLDAKAFLDANNLSYTEINVQEDQKGKKEMIEISGQMSVPVLRIGTGDVVIGFDEETLSTLLKIK